MKEFTRTNLASLRTDIEKALNEVGQKHQIALTIGNIRFSANEFRTKLEAFIANDTGNTVGAKDVRSLKEYNDLKENGSLFGLSESDYGKTFMSQGRVYKIVGLNSNAPKFPIIAEEVGTGKSYKFKETIVSKLKKN